MRFKSVPTADDRISQLSPRIEQDGKDQARTGSNHICGYQIEPVEFVLTATVFKFGRQLVPAILPSPSWDRSVWIGRWLSG